jgi:hypothetical protein
MEVEKWREIGCYSYRVVREVTINEKTFEAEP